MLIFFGIANAAAVIPAAISPPATPEPDLLDELITSPSRTVEARQEFDRNPTPEVAALDQAEGEAAPVPIAQINTRFLAELYEDEMMYPQELVTEDASLPTPATPEIPTRLIIPAIELEAPILPVEAEIVNIAGKEYQIWHAPDEFGAGWHASSATLGVAGNTVLNGHHNVNGEVFKRLVDLEPGDEIIVESESGTHHYKIVNKMILEEKYAPIEQRVQNAQWILPSQDERLTLVTCWPYESNTHRLVLVASPVGEKIKE